MSYKPLTRRLLYKKMYNTKMIPDDYQCEREIRNGVIRDAQGYTRKYCRHLNIRACIACPMSSHGLDCMGNWIAGVTGPKNTYKRG